MRPFLRPMRNAEVAATGTFVVTRSRGAISVRAPRREVRQVPGGTASTFLPEYYGQESYEPRWFDRWSPGWWLSQLLDAEHAGQHGEGELALGGFRPGCEEGADPVERGRLFLLWHY